jgi:hypothetical protein
VLRIHPQLKDDRLLNLFERGVERQWPSALLDWSQEEHWDRRDLEALAAVITPVYLGEQTAMLGVSAILPRLLRSGETEAALYLSSMGLDEARHFRNLSRFFERHGVTPWPTRRLPEMWRYHARLLETGDPLDWLWGILISDLFARLFYGRLREQYPDLLIGRLARRTLVDEARHQAFADRYLTPRLVGVESARRRALLALRDDLFRTMDALTRRLAEPLADLGWSGTAFLGELWDDTERWARRLGLVSAEGAAAGRNEAGDQGSRTANGAVSSTRVP